jgi:hypothetical protein
MASKKRRTAARPRSDSAEKVGSATSATWSIRWLPKEATLRLRHFERAPGVLEIAGVPHELAAIVERRSAAGLPATAHFTGLHEREGGWHARFAPAQGIVTHP